MVLYFSNLDGLRSTARNIISRKVEFAIQAGRPLRTKNAIIYRTVSCLETMDKDKGKFYYIRKNGTPDQLADG